jgi:hypothetical protein
MLSWRILEHVRCDDDPLWWRLDLWFSAMTSSPYVHLYAYNLGTAEQIFMKFLFWTLFHRRLLQTRTPSCLTICNNTTDVRTCEVEVWSSLMTLFLIVVPSIRSYSCRRLTVSVWTIHPTRLSVSSISQRCCHLSVTDWSIHTPIYQWPRELFVITPIGSGINNIFGTFLYTTDYTFPV